MIKYCRQAANIPKRQLINTKLGGGGAGEVLYSQIVSSFFLQNITHKNPRVDEPSTRVYFKVHIFFLCLLFTLLLYFTENPTKTRAAIKKLIVSAVQGKVMNLTQGI